MHIFSAGISFFATTLYQLNIFINNDFLHMYKHRPVLLILELISSFEYYTPKVCLIDE